MEESRPQNIIAIGAHPDDCEAYFGGTAAKLAAAGHKVKFVSVTNGDAGHHQLSGQELIDKRRSEAAEAARRLGIASSEVLDYHDGLLEPTLEARRRVIRLIRNWRADMVLTHRSNDYHPDHRSTSQLVQDSAYMVLVPNICPETPVLRKNPVYLYFWDDFQRPAPFRPDVVVDIDDVLRTKLDGLDAHASQMYEWLPWADWGEEPAPEDIEERIRWLGEKMRFPVTDAMRQKLHDRYGERGARVDHAEGFELCEYGRQVPVKELYSMLPE